MSSKAAVKVNRDGEARITSTRRYLRWARSVSDFCREKAEQVEQLKQLVEELGGVVPAELDAKIAQRGGGNECCDEACGGEENVDLCGPTFYLCENGDAGVCSL